MAVAKSINGVTFPTNSFDIVPNHYSVWERSGHYYAAATDSDRSNFDDSDPVDLIHTILDAMRAADELGGTIQCKNRIYFEKD